MRSTKRQLTLFPESIEPGNTPGFSVRKSMRAKRLTIKVFPGGRVEVVVPRRTRAAEVEAFVRDNATWIRDARESFAVDQSDEPFALPETIRLPAIGRKLTVRYKATPGATSVRYLLDGSRILLSGRTDDEKLCVQALRRCLAVVAKDELEPRLRSLSVRMNTPYKKSQIRAQRTCWGSRSGTGTISLNLCLLFLEPAVMRYLMIHELCHGRHMNHSKRFWKLVGEFEPDYQRLDRKLTESWR
ncbi:MAG: M48 family metallopeptidase, partial [Woeseiaceae bacterium]